MPESNDSKTAKLSIVPTPIGNLGDMTIRSVEALESAYAIYAEDTRMTQKLISALGLNVFAKISRLDENTMEAGSKAVADLVAGGKKVAYCSDAGMPGVSDPGIKLISHFRERGLPVEVLPGACAAVVAYVSTSFANPHFYFGGFFPRKESQRRSVLESLAGLDSTLVFYESPNRLAKSLGTIADVFPYRKVSVCRELTKLHEEVAIGLTPDMAEQFERRDQESGIKGECVIVIDEPAEAELSLGAKFAKESASLTAQEMLDGGASSKDVVKLLVERFGISKNEAYEIVIAKKGCADG